MTDRVPGPTPPTALLTLQWRTVAIASVILTLAAVSVAAVVSTVRKADTLSVIALALAILAFVIQIIIFVVQAAAASRQEVYATDIYGKTLQALSKIEEKSEGTRRAVNVMNDRLLDAAIGKAIPEAQAAGQDGSPEELVEGVSERVRELLGQSRQAAARDRRIARPNRIPDESMGKAPKGESLERAIQALEGLSGSDMEWIRRLGQYQARSGGMGDHGAMGPGLRLIGLLSAPKLHERGLVKRVRVPWSEEPVFQLTELGKDVARIMLNPADRETMDARVAKQLKKFIEYRRERDKSREARVLFKDIPVTEPGD